MPETPLRSALSTSSATRAAPACSQVFGEALDVEPELLGVGDQVARAERVLVGEQEVVHLPEAPLVGRRLGRLRGQLASGWTSFSGRCRQT